MKLFCEHCNKELGDVSLKTITSVYRDYNYMGRLRMFCDETCFQNYIKRFQIEEYNGKPIYRVIVNDEARYMPYWFSMYYFTTLEDCKRHMDRMNIGLFIPLVVKEY